MFHQNYVSGVQKHSLPKSGNILTGVAVQFATQDQKNAKQLQRCIAIFNIKICYYVVLFISIPSKMEFFAMQNSKSKLFPAQSCEECVNCCFIAVHVVVCGL